MKMITKLVNSNKTSRDDCLTLASWAYHNVYKVIIGFSPFELVFGTQPLLTYEILVSTFNQNCSPRLHSMKGAHGSNFQFTTSQGMTRINQR